MIKGHTSVKGKVAYLLIINLLILKKELRMEISKEDTKASSDGIWMPNTK